MDNPLNPSDPQADGPADDGAIAVVTPKKRPKRSDKQRQVPRYHVILWDSDDHTYEYVQRMLKELFGHNDPTCLKMAVEVDTQGKVIVLTTTLEHAELKRDQIHAYGPDKLMASSKGSMWSTVESAEG